MGKTIIDDILHNRACINDERHKTLEDGAEYLKNWVWESVYDSRSEYPQYFATGILKYEDKYFQVEFKIMWYTRDELDSITVIGYKEIILTDNLKLECIEAWNSYDDYYKKELSLDTDCKLLLLEFTGIDFDKFLANYNDNVLYITCDKLGSKEKEIIINGFKFVKVEE